MEKYGVIDHKCAKCNSEIDKNDNKKTACVGGDSKICCSCSQEEAGKDEKKDD